LSGHQPARLPGFIGVPRPLTSGVGAAVTRLRVKLKALDHAAANPGALDGRAARLVCGRAKQRSSIGRDIGRERASGARCEARAVCGDEEERCPCWPPLST
jgi:hypothetical protein